MRGLLTWLRTVLYWLLPPVGKNWPLVAFQPILYTCIWIGGLILATVGDFASTLPSNTDFRILLPIVWFVLILGCPPMALGSSWMIIRGKGPVKYRGKILRFGADIGMALSLTSYVVKRVAIGGYHIIPIAALIATTIFVVLLVVRDIRNLVLNDKLAGRLNGHNYNEQRHAMVMAKTAHTKKVLEELRPLQARVRELMKDMHNYDPTKPQ